MGVSVERTVRDILRKELADDSEALRIAEKILEAYVAGGRKAVKHVIKSMLEGELRVSATEASEG